MSHGLTTALRGAARRRPALRRALIAGRPPATAGDCVAISPLWARVYREYSLAIPEHRGKDRLLDDYAHVTPIRAALGVADGSIEITYDRRHSGIATMHPDQPGGDTQPVQLRTLDPHVDVLAQPAGAVGA